MARIRHPDRSFNFEGKGQWCEVPDADVAYLVETYGVEVEGSNPMTIAKHLLQDAGIEIDEASFDAAEKFCDQIVDADLAPLNEEWIPPCEPAPKARPIKGGWFELEDGRKVRRADLPEGAEIVE